MSLVAQFIRLVSVKGSPVEFHREDGGTNCPCRTPEGFRDPIWHRDNPAAPLCNEQGKLNPVVTAFNARGFVQPVMSSRATRESTERIISLVGEVQQDDHIAILPVTWLGSQLNFEDWSDSGTHYLKYNGRRFTVVNVNLLPDPSDGNPAHHWEVGLRLMSEERINA